MVVRGGQRVCTARAARTRGKAGSARQAVMIHKKAATKSAVAKGVQVRRGEGMCVRARHACGKGKSGSKAAYSGMRRQGICMAMQCRHGVAASSSKGAAVCAQSVACARSAGACACAGMVVRAKLHASARAQARHDATRSNGKCGGAHAGAAVWRARGARSASGKCAKARARDQINAQAKAKVHSNV